ncbi:aminotransferase class I/II-fold pyridoxal phosphate-dependent enzyme [Murimonas intestini]|uniref:LL-diaminopimelate aminotransferase n=1 Tax=Murimonas intestini TaxID=1337051 RepID=A0AB73T1N8_9FIRM|nr:aminotransferase class I/II-fold pyridoxal phosphate-dependent enzyme [Murimonas intestini]MCR1842562.1 aminotransferase class I/II-fold pyridoxal phosphate-dependent enzyme [Murimonas intestini]MCR1867391.1 aminotransferase class I/II-fold pyridoxal phosphate-dependent enzyme [Murimonas intestini]MCR1884578.1 aminotransferase class I/II-fold pyridoxal phosphate-dependent enzyme [Murimonas intestini]
MQIKFSEKTQMFQAGIFAVLNERKEELLNKGMKIYNLSVGTPDFKPAPHVMEALTKASSDPENYKYALKDKRELLDAVSDFYMERFGVSLDREEIMSVNGSQEGMAHFAWALCDPGDIVLVPDPGYPIFSAGPLLCGAKTVPYPLYRENGYLPRLSEIPEETARAAKFMIVSYPLNPVCVTAPDSFYKELISFAREYEIVILHDNAYSDIVYGGRTGGSFLAHEGAKEVGVEFYSLSKSYNLTGARISFVVGNKEIVRTFRDLRTQFDYGVFLPVQYAAIAALRGPKDAVRMQREEYEKRNHALCRGLRDIGWEVPDSQGTMFVWAPLPEGYENSEKFTLELMERSGVICVPGSSFGSLGEGYVRFALVLPAEEMEKAVQAVRESGILDKGSR